MLGGRRRKPTLRLLRRSPAWQPQARSSRSSSEAVGTDHLWTCRFGYEREREALDTIGAEIVEGRPRRGGVIAAAEGRRSEFIERNGGNHRGHHQGLRNCGGVGGWGRSSGSAAWARNGYVDAATRGGIVVTKTCPTCSSTSGRNTMAMFLPRIALLADASKLHRRQQVDGGAALLKNIRSDLRADPSASSRRQSGQGGRAPLATPCGLRVLATIRSWPSQR